MKQPEGEATLRWQDVVVIVAVISILVAAFLYQVARRSDALPATPGGYEGAPVQAVTALA